MANGFTKAWRYLMALFSSKVDEYADPKVQIQQAIEDAQRQHHALSQQAAAVIGNQRQLEMKLNRQLGEVEKLQASARQALVLADQARGPRATRSKAQQYEQSAQAFASQLVTAEQSVEDMKTLHDQAIQAAGQAKQAVERNSMMLQQKIAERTKLLSQLEQAKMQEQAANSLRQMSELAAPGQHAVAGGGPGEDRAALRQRDRCRPSWRRTRCRAGCSRCSSRPSTWPARAGWSRSGPRCAAPRWPARSRRERPRPPRHRPSRS